MRAFHSTWTRPYEHAYGQRPFEVEDFEVLTTILSALKWRQLNGSIEMITDEKGARYYEEIGISSIWDLGIRVCLDNIPVEIDPNLFWAAGKIYALKEQATSCVMIDTDFIVWENVEPLLQCCQIAVIHREQLEDCVYPVKEVFNVKQGYQFPQSGWEELACNTAFSYFSDPIFKNEYVQSAIDFMKAVTTGTDRITHMVFAEQRMLALVAKERDIPIHELMPLHQLMTYGKQQTYTHIWGYKQQMRNNPIERDAFCKRCIHRIQSDFPDYEELIWRIPGIEKYE